MGLSGFSVFSIVVLVLAILTLFAGVKTVSQGYNWTVERFGKYTTTLRPGLNLIVPFFDRIGHKMNMMERVLDVPSQEVITRDNAMVKVDGIAFYQVLDAPKAAYEVAPRTSGKITIEGTQGKDANGRQINATSGTGDVEVTGMPRGLLDHVQHDPAHVRRFAHLRVAVPAAWRRRQRRHRQHRIRARALVTVEADDLR